MLITLLSHKTLSIRQRVEVGFNLERILYDRTVMIVETAPPITPAIAETQIHLGITHVRRREYREAIGSFRRVVSERPDIPDMHLVLGLTHLVVGDKDSAVREKEILDEQDKQLALLLEEIIGKK